MLHAWVDESMRQSRDPREGAYILASVVCDPLVCEPVRDLLRSLRYQKTRRIHWRDEEPPRKTKIAVAIGGIDLAAVVVVAMPLGRQQERARARCAETLLPTLQGMGVSQVVMETRTPSLIQRDRKMIDAIRSKRLITPALRVETARPSEEPMLWLPDCIAGAVGAARAGNSEWLDVIGNVDQIEVSTA
jgi:hypothetical protein